MNPNIKLLRRYLREEIGRSYRTLNNDPYSWEDYPGIDTEIYPADLGNKYHVKITVGFDKSLSVPLTVFSTEEEARSFARKHVDIAHRKMLGQNIEI